MAVTLQRSLLPRALPDQAAVEVAYRYLPAQAGVGGDWFDVIPLPGARVALVVGDVVGHGLHAAATMGRLRTAVHNFSALDLPPDELLGHLDELVARIDSEERRRRGRRRERHRGDLPVRDLRPGLRGVHAGPGRAPGPGPGPPGRHRGVPAACRSPRRSAWAAACPSRPPSCTLPEGSRLVLYTDGLVENRDRDIDTGLDLLREALAGPGPDAGGDLSGRRSTRCCRPARATTSPCWWPAPACWTPPRSPSGRCPAIPAAVARSAPSAPAGWQSWGLEEHRLHHRTRSSASWSPTPSATAPRPSGCGCCTTRQPDLRGLRRQQHLAAPAPGGRPPTRAAGACSSSPSSPSAGAPGTSPAARSSGPSSHSTPGRPSPPRTWPTPCWTSGTTRTGDRPVTRAIAVTRVRPGLAGAPPRGTQKAV